MEEKKYDLIIFNDGEFSLDVNVSPSEDTVWLTKEQISQLFCRDRSVISKHIKNILLEKECEEKSNVQKMHIANSDKPVDFYSLDIILSVGYRVKSTRGNIFRRWANQVLKQYLLNGYSINEERCRVCSSSILELNNEIKQLKSKMNVLEETIYQENEKLLYEGEIVDAYTFIRKLFFLAKKEITIIDPYADKFLLSMLTDIKVNVSIITSSNSYLNSIELQENISLIKNDIIHDRFIIIDEIVYMIGTSINEIGKKRFVIIKSNNLTKENILK